MGLSQKRRRESQVRRRAREFASKVKQSNMALKFPDELIDPFAFTRTFPFRLR